MRRTMFHMGMIAVSLICGLTLISFVGSTASAADRPIQKICGLKSGDQIVTVADNFREAERAKTPAFSTGFAMLERFPAVRAFIHDLNVVRVCASGIVVAKNSYKNDLDLMVVETELKSGETRVLPLLVWTGSVQATEGPGASRMWLGFARAELVEGVRESLAISQLEERPYKMRTSFRPMSLGIGILPSDNVERATRGFVHVPDVDPEWETYIVSQLRSAGGPNGYQTQYMLDTAVVQYHEASGRVRLGKLNNFFNLYQGLLLRQWQHQPKDASVEGNLQRLHELSSAKLN